MAFGPDGALYVLDYGTGYFNGDHNSALYRIEHVTGGRALRPGRRQQDLGHRALTVAFSSVSTSDPDGDALSYAWTFGDGASSTAADPSHTYTANGQYTATLEVTDPSGKSATASVRITVGNTAPTVRIDTPADGRIYDFGAAIPFSVTVADPEDGAVDCSRVKVTFVIGHDSHGHPQTSATGCTGTLRTLADGEPDPNTNIFGVVDAEYTDRARTASPPSPPTTSTSPSPATGRQSTTATPCGVQIVDKASAHGGRTVDEIHDGDRISYTRTASTTPSSPPASPRRAAAARSRSARAPAGTLLGTATVPVTGGWDVFRDVTAPLSGQ